MCSSFVRFFGVVVALGSAALLSATQDEKTVATINEQADNVTKMDWKALSKQGEGLAKKHELQDVMNLFKTRKDDNGIKPDGIEAKIMSISRVPMAQATLNREKADLIRMAEQTAAIASVAVHLANISTVKGDKNPANWKKGMEEMHKESQLLIKALNKNSPLDVRNAAKRLRDTCVECHKVFRDDKP